MGAVPIRFHAHTVLGHRKYSECFAVGLWDTQDGEPKRPPNSGCLPGTSFGDHPLNPSRSEPSEAKQENAPPKNSRTSRNKKEGGKLTHVFDSKRRARKHQKRICMAVASQGHTMDALSGTHFLLSGRASFGDHALPSPRIPCAATSFESSETIIYTKCFVCRLI